MNLSEVQLGECVVIAAVGGGHAMAHRLAAMGIYPGAKVKVVRGGSGGPVVVEVRETRVLVGRGMADRITVTAEEQ